MPKFTSIFIFLKEKVNKMVNERIMSFNVDCINLLLILVFLLVSYIKTNFSVVGTVAFKEILDRIIKIKTINNQKVNKEKLSTVKFILIYINIP